MSQAPKFFPHEEKLDLRNAKLLGLDFLFPQEKAVKLCTLAKKGGRGCPTTDDFFIFYSLERPIFPVLSKVPMGDLGSRATRGASEAISQNQNIYPYIKYHFYIVHSVILCILSKASIKFINPFQICSKIIRFSYAYES